MHKMIIDRVNTSLTHECTSH